MKRYMSAVILCGCLLIGSLYPKLLLEHHIRLVDQNGKEIEIEGEYDEEIPWKLEFRFLKLFLKE